MLEILVQQYETLLSVSPECFNTKVESAQLNHKGDPVVLPPKERPAEDKWARSFLGRQIWVSLTFPST